MVEHTVTFQTRIGFLRRKPFKTIIESFCRRHKHVYYKIAESFTFSASDFTISISGDREKVELLVNRLKEKIGEFSTTSNSEFQDSDIEEGNVMLYFSNK